jgi:hypothetical protein
VATNTTSSNTGPNGQADFNSLAGASTFDASYLDIDFIPDAGVDFISMSFVFSSEEFPEYSNSIYNDVVGVWSNGVLVPFTPGPAPNVSNSNQTNNINLFNDNTNDDFNTEMDGFSVTMSMTIPVNPGVVNSIRIGIADVADANYDSNLLIAGDSLQGDLVTVDDVKTITIGGTKTVEVLDNDINQTGGSIFVTHINGVPVSVGDTVTLATGQDVTLNADGTLGVTAATVVEDVNFTYSIASTTGEVDVGFVTIDTIPCFVTGTMIETSDGEVPVEMLLPGDLVMTQDDGPQPVRWIGQRSVPAKGDLAPILIRKGALGHHRSLLVSPLHRVLIRDSLAELLFGEAEVLVAAKDLINDSTIVRRLGGNVSYVHILFDKHQVVFSDGLPTESFLPGPQTTNCFEAQLVDEIQAIFPELDPKTGDGYSPAARRTLKTFEARLLAKARAA